MGVSITTIASTDVVANSRAVINTNFSNIATDLDGFSDDLKNLTAAEISELENIGATTISAAQWGYLGATGAGGGQLLAALTTGESTQLEAIGSVTITNTQWGYLGASNQGIATTNTPQFARLGLGAAADASHLLILGATTAVSSILDEDNMVTDSATALATQQSIKKYVDDNITAQDLDTAGDSGTGAIDLDSQSLTVAGTANQITTVASAQLITLSTPQDIHTGASPTFAGLGLGAGSLTMTGSIGATGAGKLTKVWATNIESTNDFTINGNALATIYAAINQTMYIGTTAVDIDRTTGALTLAGITLTTPDIGTPSAGTLTNCTFPTLNQNTTGTAANLSGTPALPDGTAATTQSASDNTTKLATTAYVDSQVSTADALSEILANGNTTGANDIVVSTGQAIQTATSAGNTLLIQAYDTDTPAYTTFITLTANTTPTCDLASAVTIGTNYIYRVGGTDVSVADGGTGGSSAGITLFNNITGYTASGATGTTSTNLVFSTSPTLVSPALGAATATSINKITITQPATTGVLTIEEGFTLTCDGNGSVLGTNTGDNTVCTSGTATTAATLATPRDINGVSFDGSANITVTADANTLSNTILKSTVVTSSLTAVGTLVDLTVTNDIVGSITGSAETVTNATLTTALTVNTGTLTLTAHSNNDSVLTIGTGASSISGVNTGDQDLSGYALVDQTMYIGTTAVDINRGSATLNLAGIGTFACGAITSTGSLTINGGGIFTMSDTVSDDTNKIARFLAYNYDNGTETEGWQPMLFHAATAANSVYIGGGSGTYNAATSVYVYTAANVTTRTGTLALTIGSDQVAVFAQCLTDGTCEIFKEDALSIINEFSVTGNGQFDKYGHERWDMKKLYEKYPYLIHKSKDEKGKDVYSDKIGAKGDLLYQAVLQLEEKNKQLEVRIKELE